MSERAEAPELKTKRRTLAIGMVGLDTSHAVSFTRLLHDERHPHHVPGGRVVCAWPGGSSDFELSISRVGRFTREMAETFGAEIVASPEEVAERCDAVMLLAADGRTHPGLFRRIAPYGKPVFIDKPLAVSSRDAEEILRLAERHRVPVMSCSSLRFALGPERWAGGGVDSATAPRASGSPASDGSGPARSAGRTSADGDAAAEEASIYGADDAVTGADVFGPMPFQPPQPGYFWYGIHAVEMLYAVFGPGCAEVSAIAAGDHELIVGVWADGRIGTVRGNRTGSGAFGALIHHGDRRDLVEPPADYMLLYAALLGRVLELFRTGRPAVAPHETFEIIRFLEAANESRAADGKIVRLGRREL